MRQEYSDAADLQQDSQTRKMLQSYNGEISFKIPRFESGAG